MSALPHIVLVAAVGDPAAKELRKRLRAAMTLTGQLPTWQELLPGAEALPHKFRGESAAMVLVAGRKLEGETAEIMAENLRVALRRMERWAWLRRPMAAGSVVPGILLAFFPKCAGCWAAYFSVFNSLGLGIPYMPWMKHVLAATLALSVIYFARMAARRRRWLPFGVQVTGIAAVLAAQYLVRAQGLMWMGVGLVFAGSLLYAMPERWLRRLERALGFGRADEAVMG